ncbi:MAG TPA: protein kinase [Sandaracinaceae bacterium]
MSSESDDTISADGLEPAGTPRRELAPGQVFADRYEVQALLGRGGMGAVYRVHDRKLDEVVALKLLTLATDRAVDRFLREVRLARRVTHPNVARTHDLGEHEGVHFLTMEYVRGKPLDRVLEEQERLDPARAAHVAEQIAAGLEAAHAAGVVHRDLKPANVLIGEDGRVVLTDFGIARATRVDTRTHDTGALIGTPHYMAPEQVLGKPVDARADIYALGLILYELLTGRLPFESDNPLAAAVMRLHEAPADPRTYASVPDPLAELALACIAREPEARPEDAGTVREALRAFRTGTPPDLARRDPPSLPSGVGLFAPMSPGRRAVAVLPFVYRGDPAHDYLGEGLAEELIDVLSRTKGLRVLALGATKRFADERDPARIGAELGADAVVDGTVQLAGDRVRIAARLVDSDSGVQRWSERFDGRVADVFELQERMGRRVAESLRLEIDAAAHRRSAPQEAIELYLKARREVRTDMMNRAANAVVMLERCIEIAPSLTPAYPAHAIASVRAWWHEQRDEGRAREQRARASVQRAMQLAPDVAETHLARAMLSVQLGEFREASLALARALDIAPTMAEAHHYLGELQVEAGRPAEGRRRLELALELDPTLALSRFPLARCAAFDGNWEEAYAQLDALAAQSVTGAPLLVSKLRFAFWRRDREEAERILEQLSSLRSAVAPAVARIARVGLGMDPPEAARELFAQAPGWLANPRFTTLMLQIGTEMFAAAEEYPDAIRTLNEAADVTLMDVEWMRRCPILEPLRSMPGWASAYTKVEQRAADIWKR